MNTRRPSLDTQIVTVCNLPLTRPFVVSVTSRVRATASSVFGLNSGTGRLYACPQRQVNSEAIELHGLLGRDPSARTVEGEQDEANSL